MPEINLVPGDDLEGRPGGMFLKWALTWGKRIVIITELVVILAFLSRFWLDTEVANNSEKIDQKKLIILSQSDFETKFRFVFDRVTKAKAIEETTSPLTVYKQALALIPPAISVDQITATNHSVNFSGNTDEVSLGKVIDHFKNSPNFSDVSVDRVAKSTPSVNVNFALRANYVTPKKTT